MPTLRRFTATLSLVVVVLCACKTRTQAATTQAPPPRIPITHLDSPEGGMIMYGTVDGAATQPAAMSKILRIVHENCGDKPQIGKVFRFRGTDTVGVFFTVVNHPGGNKHVAGLVIAAASGPQQVEAALISDEASRFGKTVNPMIQQLFGVWHPGGAARASASAGPARPSGGASAEPAALHQIVLPDRSASVAIPDGWHIDPTSGGGTIGVNGPHKEFIYLNASLSAIDPRDPAVRQGRMMAQRYGGGAPDNRVYLPYGVNLPQAFVTLYRDAQRRNNLPVPTIQIGNSSQIPGKPCASLEGTQIGGPNPGTFKFFGVFCEDPPQYGMWMASFFLALLPESVAAQEHDTAQAILSSFQVNRQVVNAQASAYAAPAIDAIHRIGREATARYNATQAANDAQHAGYWAQQNANAAQHSEWNASQNNNARNGQGFSNYILDQTVVQDNNMYGNGTVGHGTVWNSTADALIKADPNRFESVDTPNYWQGTDY